MAEYKEPLKLAKPPTTSGFLLGFDSELLGSLGVNDLFNPGRMRSCS